MMMTCAVLLTIIVIVIDDDDARNDDDIVLLCVIGAKSGYALVRPANISPPTCPRRTCPLPSLGRLRRPSEPSLSIPVWVSTGTLAGILLAVSRRSHRAQSPASRVFSR
jgi:hypothetical protein